MESVRDGIKLSPGVLQGERILAMFERSTLGVSAIEDFDQLPIPYRAVATDLNTGDAVVLDHGSLAMAMRASMSLPGIFQPVEIDGRVLLDGGLVNQVPVDVVRAWAPTSSSRSMWARRSTSWTAMPACWK